MPSIANNSLLTLNFKQTSIKKQYIDRIASIIIIVDYQYLETNYIFNNVKEISRDLSNGISNRE